MIGWIKPEGIWNMQSDVERSFFDWACFSAQPAAEKAVKAACQRMHVEAWGHAVMDLLEELPEPIVVPAELKDAALELDKAVHAQSLSRCASLRRAALSLHAWRGRKVDRVCAQDRPVL